ncbi:MAG TPA: glycosyltransferase family 4 protein, partial [Patescibacteria group bacterium]
QYVIGTVCRLKPESGLGYLLKSLKTASEIIPNIHLIIIGEGGEKQKLIWLARQLGIEQKVRFVGWQDDLVRWINNFDLYILPSLVKDSVSTVLLEVMALGKPIIATKTGANPEIVEHGQTGIVIEPENPEMMAQVIINLYNNPDWLEQYGINGRKRIEEYFDLEKVVEEYNRILT